MYYFKNSNVPQNKLSLLLCQNCDIKSTRIALAGIKTMQPVRPLDKNHANEQDKRYFLYNGLTV